MTVSIVDLIAAEEKPRYKCRVCKLLATLPRDEAVKWNTWASQRTPAGDLAHGGTVAARILTARVQETITHSPVDKHIAERHPVA